MIAARFSGTDDRLNSSSAKRSQTGQTFTRRLGVISEASIISSIVNSSPKSGVAESIPQSLIRAKLILQHPAPSEKSAQSADTFLQNRSERQLKPPSIF